MKTSEESTNFIVQQLNSFPQPHYRTVLVVVQISCTRAVQQYKVGDYWWALRHRKRLRQEAVPPISDRQKGTRETN